MCQFWLNVTAKSLTSPYYKSRSGTYLLSINICELSARAVDIRTRKSLACPVSRIILESDMKK